MKKNSFGTILTEVLRSSGTTALLTLLVIIGAVAAALFPPLILERVINDLTAGIPASAAFALLYLALTALAGILESLQNVCITIFGQKVTHHMRSVLCSKLHRLPAAFFTEHDAGRITSRFVNDVDTVDSLFADGIISMFADACKVLSILIVIFYKSRGLGILLLLLTPLVFALTRFFQRRMLTAQLACRAAVGKVNNHVPETIRNIRMIHVFAREKYMEERYDDYISENYRATDRTNLYDSVYSPIIIMISSAVIAFMMVLAAMNSGMSAFFGIRVGTAVAMIAYVGKIFGPIESIGMEIESIQSAVAGVKRIEEFLAFPERTIPEADDTDGRSRLHMQDLSHPDCHVPAENTAEPEISFEHVTFGYEPLTPDRTSPERLVLKDFSFHVSAGETITFTGRTGAGKSTIFRLLMGLYTPVSGHVYIKGREAAGIPDAEKRALFGYVEQTFHPVTGDLAAQISLNDPAISGEDIRTAARIAGLDETILSLPEGYSAPMEKAALSQGQLQLLSIARAVAASPEILLLDEITANLDSATEKNVCDALERASQGRTVLSISHRTEGSLSGRRMQVGSLSPV